MLNYQIQTEINIMSQDGPGKSNEVIELEPAASSDDEKWDSKVNGNVAGSLTELHWSAKCGDLEDLEQCLKEEQPNPFVLAADDGEIRTPLQYVMDNGKILILSFVFLVN